MHYKQREADKKGEVTPVRDKGAYNDVGVDLTGEWKEVGRKRQRTGSNRSDGILPVDVAQSKERTETLLQRPVGARDIEEHVSTRMATRKKRKVASQGPSKPLQREYVRLGVADGGSHCDRGRYRTTSSDVRKRGRRQKKEPLSCFTINRVKREQEAASLRLKHH